MINKHFDLIEKADIDGLVANAVTESRAIDYKEVLPGGADADKREFLADVSSFANASGGDLVYGIREQRGADGKPTGIPESVVGLPGANVDAEILRLENILREGLDPRAPGVQIRHVDGFTPGPIILVRIPKSWASPHMVVYKGSSRFYSRTSRGKYELDVREIRASFASSEALPEKIRRFRDDRLAKIVAGETPVPLENGPRTVLHVLPLAAFDPATRLDLSVIKEPALRLQPISASGWSHRFNLDGLLWFTEWREATPGPNYTQLFRNGMIEAVVIGLLREWEGKKLIGGVAFEQELIIALNRYLPALKSFGLMPPIIVMLTVIGAKGYSMYAGSQYWVGGGVIDRDMLILPEVVVEDFATNATSILKSVFDTLWQACGWEKSLNYNKDGNWEAHV
jgi:hypothetical protein